jgi:hypothetical protein
MRNFTVLSAILAMLSATACSDELELEPGQGTQVDPDHYRDSSVEAVIVDFSFDGVLTTDFSFDAQKTVQDQLLYTIGHLNGDRAVGRLDNLALSNIKVDNTPNGKKVIHYHARMPVAWGHRNKIPSTYTFTLPFDVSFSGVTDFTDKHKDNCVDFSAHDVSSGNMWYYYRPHNSGCQLDQDEVVTLTAEVSRSTVNTTGKYPEYHKVWEDNLLKVVAVFGKFEDGANDASDAGIAAYNRFTRSIRKELSPFGLVTVPESIPQNPGVAIPDTVFRADLPGGRKVEVTALLVDNVRDAGPQFDRRYEELSSRADLIAYNGHAALGANVRALANKGKWVTGQYVIVFMNGCDTYAYVDGALGAAHAAVNPDDPTGTKHLDMVVNALPSFFASMSDASLAMVRGLLSVDAPMTYEQIFTHIDRSEVVLVSGEQDNVFVPGLAGIGGGDHNGEG